MSALRLRHTWSRITALQIIQALMSRRAGAFMLLFSMSLQAGSFANSGSAQPRIDDSEVARGLIGLPINFNATMWTRLAWVDSNPYACGVPRTSERLATRCGLWVLTTHTADDYTLHRNTPGTAARISIKVVRSYSDGGFFGYLSSHTLRIVCFCCDCGKRHGRL